MSTVESQRDEVHGEKVSNKNEKSIVISAFNTDIPTVLGGLGEVNDSSTPLTAIHTPGLWNAHGGVRGVFQRESKSLHYQIIKLQSGINSEFQMHMEARLISSEMLGK